MIESEQFLFDGLPAEDRERNALEFTLQKQWEANGKAQAHQWTDDALCRCWACGMDDLDWWNGLKDYERSAWLSRYRFERDRVEMGLPMRTAEYLMASENEAYEEAKKRAESWAKDIRTAFMERKPCPIQPTENYRWILVWAFQLAAVPADCLQPAPPIES